MLDGGSSVVPNAVSLVVSFVPEVVSVVMDMVVPDAVDVVALDVLCVVRSVVGFSVVGSIVDCVVISNISEMIVG